MGSSRRSPVPMGGRDDGLFAAHLDVPPKPLTPREKAAKKKKEMREKVYFFLIQTILSELLFYITFYVSKCYYYTVFFGFNFLFILTLPKIINFENFNIKNFVENGF